MISYINKSIDKLKQDALSKIFYDILKWVFFTLLGLSISNLFSEGTDIRYFLNRQITISLFKCILGILVLIAMNTSVILIIFYYKYKLIKELNFTDELTGLKNYKAFNKYLNEMINSDKSFSVILLDVDNFKEFNTQYGQNKADELLKKLGELLGNDKRVTDEVFRQLLRGDEFVIIAKDTSLQQARQAAERKRELISKTLFKIDEHTIILTVSCGVTEFKKNNDNTNSLIDRLNQALNEAKKVEGKNNTQSIV